MIETLRALEGERMILLIRHRLATVPACDPIFVLESGRIAERGTYAELPAQRGIFDRMTRVQRGTGEIAAPCGFAEASGRASRASETPLATA